MTQLVAAWSAREDSILSSVNQPDLAKAKRWLIQEIECNSDRWCRVVPAWRDGFVAVAARIAECTEADLPFVVHSAGHRFQFSLDYDSDPAARTLAKGRM